MNGARNANSIGKNELNIRFLLKGPQTGNGNRCRAGCQGVVGWVRFLNGAPAHRILVQDHAVRGLMWIVMYWRGFVKGVDGLEMLGYYWVGLRTPFLLATPRG